MNRCKRICSPHDIPVFIVYCRCRVSGYESEYGRFTRWLEEHYPEAVELRNVSYGIAKEFTSYPDVFADGGAVAELPAPDDAVDVEAVTLPAGVSVELDAATAKAVDAIRLEGESRADAIRRAVESLAGAK